MSRLLVVVWNLRVGGGNLDEFWDRIASQAGGAPVVLLLQEAFSAGDHVPPMAADFAYAGRIADEPAEGRRVDIGSFARRTRLHAFYVPSMRNGRGQEDRGNAVLSTMALSGLRGLELPFERQRRVAALATVRFPGLTLEVCSVHLDNRAPWSRAWRSLGAARARQMGGLLGRMAQGIPSVLGGDFNTWVRGVDEAAYRMARTAFPQPPRPDGRPTHHFEVGGVLRRSDHLLFRLPEGWTAEVVRLDERFGSDHYPLLGWVTPDQQPAGDTGP